ncbi:MAG: carbohydrate ABC transporter substrate-binding protein [Actinobacteria bacterium]|nr:carbohydrate ABC transporter substrate-binding protein [Actinomycetota bacterium]NCV80485.1 carbohydrate ABC transporter substrate-binding protein [Actinomycetota bacterium]NCV98002.1 carbohydrate ABC transporter substrate-binding protein [Actinomycetota bacterium]NCW22552.1 carbohydrate ABC transporter substrate-binding protein [Actinomycetota bacterium]NCW41496.1 carbohydrate ABC transporter substrate-binding protein [Actinomycetota bacterium]
MQITSKRTLTFALSTVLTLGLVGCATTPAEEETSGSSGSGGSGTSETATGTVEVFSWWTGGGEEAGLNALVEVFNAEYPNIEFVNAAVAGGAGTNARAVLATRLEANDPPDSFQGHAGAELMDYITAGQLEDLSALYEEQGWAAVMPETLLPLITVDGAIYSVPVNIHRANVMWANPSVLADNGISIPNSWDEFFVAAETLEAAGIIPLALGEQWTQLHLFETVLLGELGTDAYNGLWDGSTDWGSSAVGSALATFDKVLSYTNADAASLAWQDASQLVINGDAAFNIMGDWAEGFFRVDNSLVEQVGYTWAPAPGTAGTFQFLSDSFTLPKGAPDRDSAIAWLKVAGSAAGQDAFNVKKGSIPARNDADKSIYPPYLQSAMDDWGSNLVAGSLTHGVTASNAWKAEIDTALGLFLIDGDVAAFQAALVTAAG